MFDIDVSGVNWIEEISESQKTTIKRLLDSGNSEEEIAEIWLTSVGSSSTLGFGTISSAQVFYKNVKKEFIYFICGHEKYKEEREQAAKIWKEQGKLGFVSIVAAVVASTLGLAVAAIVPVIALLLSVVSKVGVGAFCATCNFGSEG